MSKTRDKSNEQLVIAVSFNQKKGGAASDSVRKIVTASGASLLDIDYYAITPENAQIENFYTDTESKSAVLQEAKKRAEIYLSEADCLILPGNGANVDPRLYGKELSEKDIPKIDLRRAIAEMALTHIAIQKGMPILAICGGHQIINVYMGGKITDIDDDDIYDYMDYSINTFVKESQLANVIFCKSGEVESSFFGGHAQVVDPNNIGGKGMIMQEKDFLAVVATAKNQSRNIEAMEAVHGAPLYSLQFHPEIAVAGMYSILYKCITYQAKTMKQIELNLRVFKALLDATHAYAVKRKANVKIKEAIPKTKHSTSKYGEKKEAAKTKTTKQSYHKLFTESKTKYNDTAQNRSDTDKNPKKI